MAIDVSIRGVPQKDGEACPVFYSVSWWDYRPLMKDGRFRVTDTTYYFAVGCLEPKEVRELQDRYRSEVGHIDHLKRESDRLDSYLSDKTGNFRWWVVSVFEWDGGSE